MEGMPSNLPGMEGMESSGMLKQADKFMKMLDDMHQNNPEEYSSYITKVLAEGKSQFKLPEFRFSIHATNRSTKEKHYINICSYEPVPAPKTDNDPVSVFAGATIPEVIADDTVKVDYLGINPKVLDEVGDDKSLRKMLVKLAIDYYNDIEKADLSYDCGVSKKLVGKEISLTMSFSKSKKKDDAQSRESQYKMSDIKLPFQAEAEEPETFPEISIIPPKPEPKGNLFSQLISELSATEESPIKFATEVLTRPKHCVRLTARIDFIESMKDIDLEIVEDEIVVTTDGYSETRCKIPEFHRVIEDSVKAKFSKNKLLTVTFILTE